MRIVAMELDHHLWKTTMQRLERDIPEATREWLRSSRLVATQTPNHYILQVPSSAAKKQFDMRSRVHIERALTDALGGNRRVRVMASVVRKGSGHHAPAGDYAEPLFPDESLMESATPSHSPSLDETLPKAGARPSVADRRRQRQMRQTRGGTPARQGDAVQDSANSRTHGTRAAAAPPMPEAPIETPHWLNERYTFDNFIVGNGNHFAYAASVAVGDAPGDSYNPLFLYGGVGLGKTHLLHAIAHAVAPRGYRVLYVTSETFTNEIINAIRYRTTEEFRAKYRSVDVLLVDDIQFIAGKDSTEEEFFHTFNALHEGGKQIVMCSDRPPKEIDLEERLRSRFEWGLAVDIQPPDLETRMAILRAKADTMDFAIPDPVMDFLAERIHTNVRELEGMLNRVVAFARLQRVPLSLDVVKQALMNLTPADKPRRRVTPDEILVAVSAYYHISLDLLRSKQRDQQIVKPRQIAMWLMRQETELSLMDVGKQLGGRDHSTVLHSCEKIEREMSREGSPLALEVNTLRQQIAG